MTDVDPAAALSRALESIERDRPQVRAAGVEALHRLIPLAYEDDAQGDVVRALLLGCYNGRDFPFQLNSIRVLDRAVLEDCLALLHMDSAPEIEVHQHLVDGSEVFNGLAERWKQPGSLLTMTSRRDDVTSEVLRTIGTKSLKRLIQIATEFSGQCRYVAGFLAGCYDGASYPFDLTDFRCVDHELFLDCLAVMRLLYETRDGIQANLPAGEEVFGRLIEKWSIKTYAGRGI
ncbi:DUF7673 family protein (plasmid) [Pseudomonas nitroreducens]|uniref:DUF7673 family protein n=1 Tax=Pseudomonas TaxID=286 RepID=UPI000363F39C|nr:MULTISPECIES: hypothetical protein [Pseudomonas]MDU4255892.1 hypothetical protein [Pseudomonas sp.]HBO6305042.1 hypothetical protein [Pseudomonas aeruginosa]